MLGAKERSVIAPRIFVRHPIVRPSNETTLVLRSSSLFPLLLLAAVPALAQPGPFLHADLQYAMHVCSDTTYATSAEQPGVGEVEDLDPGNRGCIVSNEQQGVWMHIQVATAGQLAFTLTPAQPVDLDFAVWGPFSGPVSVLGSPPVRCSYAGLQGATGLNYTATDLSEAAGGDGRVRYLDVLPGEWYMLYVTRYIVAGLDLALTWQLQGGASLACLEAPEADLTGPVGPVSPGALVDFLDASTGHPYAWYWEFPGGVPAESLERDPQGIVYAEVGCHDVQLTVYNAAGSSTVLRPCAVEVEVSTGLATVGPAAFTLRQQSGLLHVVPTDLTGPAEVRVVDLRGRVVVTVSGTGAQVVPVGPVGAGAYVVEVLQGGGRAARSIVLVP